VRFLLLTLLLLVVGCEVQEPVNGDYVRVQGVTYTAKDSNERFEEIFELLGRPLPCLAVDGTSLEPCMTENVDGVLEALRDEI